MKVLMKDLIDANATLIRNWVPALMPGDDTDLIAKRMGDLITMSDVGNDDAQNITITVKPFLAIAVTKGADADEIMTLLKGAINGAPKALGTNPKDLMMPILNFGDLTANMLKELRTTAKRSSSFDFVVKVKNLDPRKTLRATLLATGSTRTMDDDKQEIANLRHTIYIGNDGGNTVVTQNIATERLVPIPKRLSEKERQVQDPEEMCQAIFHWELETSGGTLIDTASVVQIEQFSIELSYVSEKEEDPANEGKSETKDQD